MRPQVSYDILKTPATPDFGQPTGAPNPPICATSPEVLAEHHVSFVKHQSLHAPAVDDVLLAQVLVPSH